MPADPNIVRYLFDLESGELVFEINTGETEPPSPQRNPELPEWTLLQHHQCPCCPLKSEQYAHCPAAARIYPDLETFQNSTSIEKVRLTVETARRTYSQACDLQTGLNSMLGLRMATSGCPLLGKLRTMATFHVPFSSSNETLYRTVSAYLTQQFFIYKENGTPDWDLAGLKNFYEDLEQLNQAFSLRIRSIDRNDAVSNAIIIFFSASVIVADSIEEGLVKFKDYFTGKSVVPPTGE